MTTKIEGVPEGWELVRFGKVIKGDWFISHNGTPLDAQCNTHSHNFYPIVRKVPKPLTIEAGKYYKMKIGDVTGPIVLNAARGTFVDKLGREWNGSGVCTTSGSYTNYDLTEEVPKPFTLEAGKYYKTTKGNVIGPMVEMIGGGFSHIGGGTWLPDGQIVNADHKGGRLNLVEEAPKPEPRYRPFKNAKEFMARKDDWIWSVPGQGFAKVIYVDDKGVGLQTWEPMFVEFGIAFTSFHFEDGTPFGVLVSE